MNESLKVGLMAQGTSSEAAWSIAQGGFGIAASLDEGWYGNGEFFNSQFPFSIFRRIFIISRSITFEFLVYAFVFQITRNLSDEFL